MNTLYKITKRLIQIILFVRVSPCRSAYLFLEHLFFSFLLFFFFPPPPSVLRYPLPYPLFVLRFPFPSSLPPALRPPSIVMHSHILVGACKVCGGVSGWCYRVRLLCCWFLHSVVVRQPRREHLASTEKIIFMIHKHMNFEF